MSIGATWMWLQTITRTTTTGHHGTLTMATSNGIAGTEDGETRFPVAVAPLPERFSSFLVRWRLVTVLVLFRRSDEGPRIGIADGQDIQ